MKGHQMMRIIVNPVYWRLMRGWTLRWKGGCVRGLKIVEVRIKGRKTSQHPWQHVSFLLIINSLHNRSADGPVEDPNLLPTSCNTEANLVTQNWMQIDIPKLDANWHVTPPCPIRWLRFLSCWKAPLVLATCFRLPWHQFASGKEQMSFIVQWKIQYCFYKLPQQGQGCELVFFSTFFSTQSVTHHL